MKKPPTSGFLYGEACGERFRGGRCVLTLGHGGPHRKATDREYRLLMDELNRIPL